MRGCDLSVCDKTLLAKNIKKITSIKITSVRSEGSVPPCSQIWMQRLKIKAQNLLQPFPMLPSTIVAFRVPQGEPDVAEAAPSFLAER